MEHGRNKGMKTGTLYIWAMVFMACGVIGSSIIQNGILDIGALQADQLLQKMQSSGWMMAAATVALMLQALETCAVPVFAFLLIENGKDQEKLPDFGILLAVALISEIPYDLAFSGKLLDLESQNPALGVVVAMLVLYFWKRCKASWLQNFLIQAAVLIAGLVWVNMLHIRHGTFQLMILCVLWAFRGKPLMRSLFGPTAGVICSILSPFYLISPMGFLLIHFYNGEKSEKMQWAGFFVYPIMLLAAGLISAFL